jgi:hypothetical protein
MCVPGAWGGDSEGNRRRGCGAARRRQEMPNLEHISLRIATRQVARVCPREGRSISSCHTEAELTLPRRTCATTRRSREKPLRLLMVAIMEVLMHIWISRAARD